MSAEAGRANAAAAPANAKRRPACLRKKALPLPRISVRRAAPVVIALAVAGFALSLPAAGRRVDWWACGAAVGVYLVFGAPVLLSGRATFAGWIKLDDTANWFGLTDRLMEHGRTLAGL